MPLHRPKVRGDLEYFEREMEGDEVVIVRDPIRGNYYKYNTLQAAMLKSLDGVRSIPQMVELLSEQFEVEIPLATAERFVAHVQKLMLLDVSCYGVPAPRAHKAVLAALARKGIRFRNLKGGDDAPTQRVASGEAVLFMGGIRQLQAGQPIKALDYFCAVLELNPDNQRARILVDTIQTAYVKAVSGSSSDWPTVLKLDPSRVLALLDRTIGRLVFHRHAWLALVALVASAAYCYATTDYPSPRLGPFEIAGAVVLFILHGYLHEFGHALACHHHGGRVNEIGFTALYYITLSPYCDTSSSYLFKNRGHKIAVQLGGTIVTLTITSLLFIALSLLSPSMFLYTSMYVVVWLTTVSLFFNLIPFMKLDGYYALCDYFDVPNLRERSTRTLKSWAGAALLGLPRNEEKLSPNKRRLFIGFAVASLTFTVFWITRVMSWLLLPAVIEFRATGFVVAVVLVGYLMRRWLFLPLIRLARLLVKERRTIFTPRRSVVLGLIFVAIVGPWLIPIAVRVDAELALVPRQRAEVRAHVEGFVERVLVREGEAVREGQLLAQLRSPELELRVRVAEAELDRADARLQRLELGARPEEIAVASRQLGMARAAQIRTAVRSATAAKLAAGGMGPRADATAASGAAAVDSSLADAALWKLASVTSGAREEEIAAASAERARFAAQLEHARASAELLAIRSPIDGIVATRQLEQRRHERIAPGDTILEVLDTSELVAEIRVPPSAPLDELAAGDTIVLQAFGAPGEQVRCAIARIRDASETASSGAARPSGLRTQAGDVVVISTPFRLAKPVVGMAGHARLFGADRSIAYTYLYLPVQRALRITLQM